MITITQAAAALGVTKMTIWRHIQRGNIPATQVGTTWIIERLPDHLPRLKPGRKPKEKQK